MAYILSTVSSDRKNGTVGRRLICSFQTPAPTPHSLYGLHGSRKQVLNRSSYQIVSPENHRRQVNALAVSPQTSIEQVLHELPPFLPERFFKTAALQISATVALLILTKRVAQIMIERFLRNEREKEASSVVSRSSSSSSTNSNGLAIQTVHLLVNIFLAAAGIIVMFQLRGGPFVSSPTPTQFSHLEPGAALTALSRLGGYENLAFFGSVQAGYELWSLYTDSLLHCYHQTEHNTNRHPTKPQRPLQTFVMTLHHCLAFFEGLVFSLATFGGRLYAPFFTGLTELSSIPLSILTGLERFGRKFIKRFPRFYNLCRMSFAFTFLSVRGVAWYFVFGALLRDVIALIRSAPGSVTVWIPCVAIVPGIGLSLMQMYWGWLIVKGLVKKKTKRKDKKVLLASSEE